MKLFCPGCSTAIDGAAAMGVREMHCPECGIRFTVPESDAHAAKWGPVTTSKLAVIALVAGVGSLMLPFCLCPFLLLGAGTTTRATATRTVPPPRMVVTPAQPVPATQPATEEEAAGEGSADPEAGDGGGDDG